jgi:hypothetical protein
VQRAYCRQSRSVLRANVRVPTAGERKSVTGVLKALRMWVYERRTGAGQAKVIETKRLNALICLLLASSQGSMVGSDTMPSARSAPTPIKNEQVVGKASVIANASS